LLYGAQRLVSPLDWANTRRTFDGGRFLYKGDTWNVDGFFVHPVNRNAANESKIDDTNEAVDFWGLYASRDDLSIGNVEVYYLGLVNDLLNFDYHTLGSRLTGTTAGGTMYEVESGYQFGSNSNGSDHSATFFTAGLGRKLEICTRCGEWNPIVWAWYDFASGEDDPTQVARGDDGFDHLFPLAHKYNGLMDLFGRRNLNDVNFQFITPLLGPKVKLLLWYHYFFLDERTTPYGVTLAPFNPANVAGDRELGHELDVLFNVTVTPRTSMLLGYSYFSAGDYYDTTAGVPTNQDAQFFYMQYQTRF
ncbi:MAG: alginate export family protein, partial [Pirellulales bacterium]|nr:alginate export family protein [Pirellulales bacterium]